MACGPFSDVVVTGRTGGTVYGSNPYTDDSDLGTAAVHAGLIKTGETATIERYDAQVYSSYTGSSRNGVTTSTYSSPWCGFKIRLKAGTTVTDTCGDDVSGSLVTGRNSGFSYGGGSVNGPYRSDVDPGLAAVHAGLISVGQTAYVDLYDRAVYGPYVGSTRNGITTYSTSGSSTFSCGYFIRLSAGPQPESSAIIPGCFSQIARGESFGGSGTGTRTARIHTERNNTVSTIYGNGSSTPQVYYDLAGPLNFSQSTSGEKQATHPSQLIFCVNTTTFAGGPTDFGGDLQIKVGSGDWFSLGKLFNTSRLPGYSEDRTHWATYNGFLVGDYSFRIGYFNTHGAGALTIYGTTFTVFATSWSNV